MKRIFLILMVLIAVVWTGYASYDLWFNKANQLSPVTVFCPSDESVLLIHNFKEIQSTDYLSLMQENPLTTFLPTIDSVLTKDITYYVSGKRPIILIKKEDGWASKNLQKIKKIYAKKKINIHANGHYLLISQNYKPCTSTSNNNFFQDLDKKASANYWQYDKQQWKRTDVYNLQKGYYRYQSSATIANFGNPIKEIPLFSSVIPYDITHYIFKERFYATTKDSVLKNGPMQLWLNKGWVEIMFQGERVLVSDYRSQQVPSLILKEQVKNNEDYKKIKDLTIIRGIQLTKDFPQKKGTPIYVFGIENKSFFTTSKEIARKIMVAYQLGNTLALHPEQEKQFFGGLPSYVNYREISKNKKMSVTWKGQLRFEVNTRPPKERLQNIHKLTWSNAIDYSHYKLHTIYDHLRNGVSVFAYSNSGNYQLIGPNGGKLWEGRVSSPIEGYISIVDVFDNNKHQFLFRTKDKVYLIDLNRNTVGGFPFKRKGLSTKLSTFIWEGTKRFLVGDNKGNITMISNAGKAINTIQTGNNTIQKTPFALNVNGKLRAWSINSKNQTFLGYLETDKHADKLEKQEANYVVKHDGKILCYFQKNNKIYFREYDSDTDKLHDIQNLVKGTIILCTPQYLVIQDGNTCSVFNHSHQLKFSKTLPFHEIDAFVYIPEKKITLISDALKNKIYAYSVNGTLLDGYPKEGRKNLVAQYSSYNKTLYVFTSIGQSIICYKTKF